MKYILTFFIILVFANSKAQNLDYDNLESNSYNSLLKLYNTASDSVIAKKIARAYINKSLKDLDSNKMALGYVKLAERSKRRQALKYLDTSIALTKNSKHKNFPALAYINKSHLLYEKEEYEKSLQNSIHGYQASKRNNNIDQEITSLHQIIRINELWGDYSKALETSLLTYNLLKANPEIEHYAEHYLYALEDIGKCYIRLKKPDSALVYYNMAIKETLKQKDSFTYLAFVSRTGSALYAKGNYNDALDSLQKGDKNRNLYNSSYLPYYYYYIGSTYYNQGNKERGVPFLQKVDSIYEKTHVLNPELPLVYDKLVSYYEEKNEQEKQLDYLYKLVRVVRIIDAKRVNIKNKTNEDYIIPNLLEEKESLIEELNKKNKTSNSIIWLVAAFLVISIGGLFYYIKRQRQFKLRFEQLISKQEAKKKKSNSIDTDSKTISVDIIEDILNKLDAFEKENKFLSKEVSLNKISKSFETNSTYLSKVINLKKDKNFSQYINDLRIQYAFKELEVNSKFRRYTIKAIASECGFKSSESFSKAFYKSFGIYPSYFIKQLENKKT